MSGAQGATLLLGGARSGKSRLGERLAALAANPIYVATAHAGDGEMAARIAAHRERRGPRWSLIEEKFDLTGVIAREAASDRAVLVDCLTLWLTNLIMDDRDWRAAAQALCGALGAAAGPVIFISNEVGLGVVPETPLGRRFRDDAGALNQQIAALCGRVAFVAAGLPLMLKGPAFVFEETP